MTGAGDDPESRRRRLRASRSLEAVRRTEEDAAGRTLAAAAAAERDARGRLETARAEVETCREALATRRPARSRGPMRADRLQRRGAFERIARDDLDAARRGAETAAEALRQAECETARARGALGDAAARRRTAERTREGIEREERTWRERQADAEIEEAAVVRARVRRSPPSC